MVGKWIYGTTNFKISDLKFHAPVLGIVKIKVQLLSLTTENVSINANNSKMLNICLIYLHWLYISQPLI